METLKLNKLLLALTLGALTVAGTADAKLIHRWDPAALAQGKFQPIKTAFVKKEGAKQSASRQEGKRRVVRIHYNGKLSSEPELLAKSE